MSGLCSDSRVSAGACTAEVSARNAQPELHLPELLAPAGNVAAFNAALAGGADAIYCAFGKDFNARRFAESFSEAEFTAACQRAHLVGVKVYVTCNVLIADDELPRALSQLHAAWTSGADAVIVQDWGLFSAIRQELPDFEIHISTQANVHDLRGVLWCAKAGAQRVTLSRELSLAEISSIAPKATAAGCEVECFCHGALCICYSGECLMSSFLGGRSANRGMCAQPCRLPYELVDEGGAVVDLSHIESFGMIEGNRGLGGVRTLCPRDFCTIDELKHYVRSGVSSLKIEGRMKASDYVYTVVQSYREALDELAPLLEGAAETPGSAAVPTTASVLPYERHRCLKRVFNRDFTCGYLYGEAGNAMMSYERSNNRGEEAGIVVAAQGLEDIFVRRGGSKGGRSRLRKVSRADVKILLTAPVGAGDLLEIRPVDDPSRFLVVTVASDASSGETICCRASREMPAGSKVRVIRSELLFKAAKRLEHKEVLRRRAVTVLVRAQLFEPLLIELTCADGAASVRVEVPAPERSRSKALTTQDILEHVGRMGNSPFVATSWDISVGEDVGLSFSELHRLRQRACEALSEAILEPYRSRAVCAMSTPEALAAAVSAEPWDAAAPEPDAAPKDVAAPEPTAESDAAPEPEVCALVRSPAAAQAARSAGARRLYARPEDLVSGVFWPTDVIPWLDEVCRSADKPLQDPLVAAGYPVCVQNVSQMALARSRGAIPEIGPGIPLHNRAAFDFFASAGARSLWMGHELSLEEIGGLALYARSRDLTVGYVVFGKEQLMLTEHCILQVLGDCDHRCALCSRRKHSRYLKNIDGMLLPVESTSLGRSRIFAAAPHDAVPEICRLVQAGVSRFLVDATLLSDSELQEQILRVQAALSSAAARNGNGIAAVSKACLSRYPGSSSGHLYAKIE